MIAVTDSSKLRRRNLSVISPVDTVDRLITDRGADTRAIEAIRARGVEVQLPDGPRRVGSWPVLPGGPSISDANFEPCLFTRRLDVRASLEALSLPLRRLDECRAFQVREIRTT